MLLAVAVTADAGACHRAQTSHAWGGQRHSNAAHQHAMDAHHAHLHSLLHSQRTPNGSHHHSVAAHQHAMNAHHAHLNSLLDSQQTPNRCNFQPARVAPPVPPSLCDCRQPDPEAASWSSGSILLLSGFCLIGIAIKIAIIAYAVQHSARIVQLVERMRARGTVALSCLPVLGLFVAKLLACTSFLSFICWVLLPLLAEVPELVFLLGCAGMLYSYRRGGRPVRTNSPPSEPKVNTAELASNSSSLTQQPSSEVDESHVAHVAALVAMGFTEQAAKLALQVNGGLVADCAEWIVLQPPGYKDTATAEQENGSTAASTQLSGQTGATSGSQQSQLPALPACPDDTEHGQSASYQSSDCATSFEETENVAQWGGILKDLEDMGFGGAEAKAAAVATSRQGGDLKQAVKIILQRERAASTSQ